MHTLIVPQLNTWERPCKDLLGLLFCLVLCSVSNSCLDLPGWPVLYFQLKETMRTHLGFTPSPYTIARKPSPFYDLVTIGLNSLVSHLSGITLLHCWCPVSCCLISFLFSCLLLVVLFWFQFLVVSGRQVNLLLLWLLRNILPVCLSLFICQTRGHTLGADYQLGKKPSNLQMLFPSFSRKAIKDE